MTQGQQPITTRFLTWFECLTTTAETPVNTRFVNADGKSIMDLLAEEGSDIVAFYQAKGDIHAFLTKHNLKLDDFKWDSPFGLLSISEALAKINAGEIKIPIGGRSQLWSLERMLCFKGNTYAELFVSTGTIVYGRMREMAQQLNVNKLVLGISFALLGAGYAAYYSSVALWTVVGAGQVDQKESAKLSNLVISNSLRNGLPVFPENYASLRPEATPSIALAESDIKSYLGNYGADMAGDYWPSIEQSIARIEASQGRSGVTDEATSNFFSLVKNGLPLNPQSCAEIEANPEITRMGQRYSIALYAGALDEQAAVDALSAMISSWRKSGKVELPVRSQMYGNVQKYRLDAALNHVGSMLSDGTISKCAIAPIVGVAPSERPAAPNNYTLVSMLVRTPLVNGSAGVSMRLYAFANNPDGTPAKVLQAKVVEERNDLSKVIASQIPEFAPKSSKPDDLTLLLESIPDRIALTKEGFASWTESGEFPSDIPVVSLEELISHKIDGNSFATPVVAYELDSDVTKYLVSAIQKDRSGFSRALFSVYEAEDERGVIEIACADCVKTGSFDSYPVREMLKTAEDFRNELLDTPYGSPDVDISEVTGSVMKWLERKGYVKNEEDFNAKLKLAEDKMIANAADFYLNLSQNKNSLINYKAILEKMVVSGIIVDGPLAQYTRSIQSEVNQAAYSRSTFDLDALVDSIQAALARDGAKTSFTENESEAIKAIALDVLKEPLKLTDFDIKEALISSYKSANSYDELRFNYDAIGFINGSKALEELLSPFYSRSRDGHRILSKVDFSEFESAICSSFGIPMNECSSAIAHNSQKDFLKDQ